LGALFLLLFEELDFDFLPELLDLPLLDFLLEPEELLDLALLLLLDFLLDSKLLPLFLLSESSLLDYESPIPNKPPNFSLAAFPTLVISFLASAFTPATA